MVIPINTCFICKHLRWKVAAMLAEGDEDVGASPVVYVSGEEVCFY